VWMLTGLWHGASWNFVLWGLMFAVLLLIEKWVLALQKLSDAARHGYVLFLVMVSFVLFNAESLAQAGSDLAGLFGFGRIPVITQPAVYYLRSYAPLFLAGFVGATPVVRDLAARIGQTRIGAVLEPLVLLVLLLVCTGYLVDGSFSPFLYFRF